MRPAHALVEVVKLVLVVKTRGRNSRPKDIRISHDSQKVFKVKRFFRTGAEAALNPAMVYGKAALTAGLASGEPQSRSLEKGLSFILLSYL